MSGASAAAHHDVSTMSPVIRRNQPTIAEVPDQLNEQDLTCQEGTFDGPHIIEPEPERTTDNLIPFLLDFHKDNYLSIEGLIKYV